MHIAAQNGHNIVVVALLRATGGDVDAKDSDGCTPLHHAARKGHDIVVDALLRATGGDVNAKDFDGWTPLHYAARNGQENCIRALVVEFKADIFALATNGYSPMHYARENEMANSVTLLRQLAADPAVNTVLSTLRQGRNVINRVSNIKTQRRSASEVFVRYFKGVDLWPDFLRLMLHLETLSREHPLIFHSAVSQCTGNGITVSTGPKRPSSKPRGPSMTRRRGSTGTSGKKHTGPITLEDFHDWLRKIPPQKEANSGLTLSLDNMSLGKFSRPDVEERSLREFMGLLELPNDADADDANLIQLGDLIVAAYSYGQHTIQGYYAEENNNIARAVKSALWTCHLFITLAVNFQTYFGETVELPVNPTFLQLGGGFCEEGFLMLKLIRLLRDTNVIKSDNLAASLRYKSIDITEACVPQVNKAKEKLLHNDDIPKLSAETGDVMRIGSLEDSSIIFASATMVCSPCVTMGCWLAVLANPSIRAYLVDTSHIDWLPNHDTLLDKTLMFNSTTYLAEGDDGRNDDETTSDDAAAIKAANEAATRRALVNPAEGSVRLLIFLDMKKFIKLLALRHSDYCSASQTDEDGCTRFAKDVLLKAFHQYHDDELGRTSLSGGQRRGPLPKPLLRRCIQMEECYSYIKNTDGSDFDDSITSVHVVIFNVKAIKSKLWTMENFAKVSMCCRSCHRRGCGVFSHAQCLRYLSFCLCSVVI